MGIGGEDRLTAAHGPDTAPLRASEKGMPGGGETSRPMASNPEPVSERSGLAFSDPAEWPYLMTILEVADVLRIKDAKSVQALIDSGELKAINISGGIVRRRVRVPRDNLRAFIHHARTASKPEAVPFKRRNLRNPPPKLRYF